MPDISKHVAQRRIYPQTFPGEAQPEYGIRASTVKIWTIYLDNARTVPEKKELGGNVLWVVGASGLGAVATIYLGDEQIAGDGFQVSEGFFLGGLAFSRVFVENTAQAGEYLTVLTAVDDSREVRISNPGTLYNEIDLVKASVLDSAADVTLGAAATTQILAANNARRAAIIANLAGNSNTMRIGDSNAAAARGIPLAPGESITIESTESIHGYNPGGAGEDVAVIWTAD